MMNEENESSDTVNQERAGKVIDDIWSSFPNVHLRVLTAEKESVEIQICDCGMSGQCRPQGWARIERHNRQRLANAIAAAPSGTTAAPSVSDAIAAVERLYDEWWDIDRRRWLNVVLERLRALPTAEPVTTTTAASVISGGKEAVEWQRRESEKLNSGSSVDELSRARRDSEACSVTPNLPESSSERHDGPVTTTTTAARAAEEIVGRVYGGDKDEFGELEAIVAAIITRHFPTAAAIEAGGDELFNEALEWAADFFRNIDSAGCSRKECELAREVANVFVPTEAVSDREQYRQRQRVRRLLRDAAALRNPEGEGK